MSMIYVTTGSKKEALDIGRALIEARLAACANVIGGVTSIFRWQGKIERSEERRVGQGGSSRGSPEH